MEEFVQAVNELTTLAGSFAGWITDTRSFPTNLPRFQLFDSKAVIYLASLVAQGYTSLEGAREILTEMAIHNPKKIFGKPEEIEA